MPDLISQIALLSGSSPFFFGDEGLRYEAERIRTVFSHSHSLDASNSSSPGPWTRCVTPTPSPAPLSIPSPSASSSPPPAHPETPGLGPLPLDRLAEAGGNGAMVALSGRNLLTMSAASTSENKVQGSSLTPHHFKPFGSHEHYKLVMCAFHKLQESGFYWGALGGREASTLLRSEPPGTFLIRDSSDHHYFFTLSVKTTLGTRNLRIHSGEGGFFLQPDPQSTQRIPRFDCVLKLIAHFMGKGADAGGARDKASGGGSEETTKKRGQNVYLIHTAGEKIPLELQRPLCTSLSTLQHMCRRTLNDRGLAGTGTEDIPSTLRDFLEAYDAPI